MEKISISDYFKKELNIKHNPAKLKEVQELNRDSYEIKLEKQNNGKDGMSLYYEGDKGLITFLEDYLELFDPNIPAAQNTVMVIDGKIRDLINEGSEGMKEVKETNEVKEVKKRKVSKENKKVPVEEKYTVDEIRTMFSEFIKLEEMFAPREEEIGRWLKLREIFKK